MTLQQEIATELRSLAAWFREISRITHMPCTSELNLKRADKWDALAARVENARCETCAEYEECDIVELHINGLYCSQYQEKVNK